MSTPSITVTTNSMKKVFVRFPHIKRLLERMDELYKHDCVDEEAENVLLLGESGVGKSRLLQKFRNTYPPIIHEDFTEIPVLYLKVPSKGSINSLASAMLLEMRSVYWDRGTTIQLTKQLTKLLITCKVRIIILDEINHLVEKGGIKTHHGIADWLKILTDETSIPFILAGIPRAERLLHANDQLRSRFREVITIQPFSVENEKEKAVFRSVLKTFSQLIVDVPSVDLASPEMVDKMAFATAGRLRDIRRLLVRAVEVGGKRSPPKISNECLSDAFCQVIYPNAPDERNPFCTKFKKIPLTRANEPFAAREE